MKCYFCEKKISWDNSYGSKYCYCENCFVKLNKYNQKGLALIFEKDKKIFNFYKNLLTKNK